MPTINVIRTEKVRFHRVRIRTKRVRVGTEIKMRVFTEIFIVCRGDSCSYEESAYMERMIACTERFMFVQKMFMFVKIEEIHRHA